MSLDLIKKKIQLYVSESGAQKSAKYYRIPTPSDSMEYSRENNAFKNCVRWYARVSGDRISFAAFTRRYPNTNEFTTETTDYSYNNKKSKSLTLLEPVIPDSLLNERESTFSITKYNARNGVLEYRTGDELYNSSAGFTSTYFDGIDISSNDYGPGVDKIRVQKDSIFLNSAVVTSDVYSDLSSEVPSTWVALDSIDAIVAEVEEFINGNDSIDRGPELNVNGELSKEESNILYITAVYDRYIEATQYDYHRGVARYDSFNLSSANPDNQRNVYYVFNKGGRLVGDKFTVNVNVSALTERVPNNKVYIAYKLMNDETAHVDSYTKEQLATNPSITINNFSTYNRILIFTNDNTKLITLEGELDTANVPDFRRINDRLTRFETNRTIETLDDFNDSETKTIRYDSRYRNNPTEIVVDSISNISSLTVKFGGIRSTYVDAINKDGTFTSIFTPEVNPSLDTDIKDLTVNNVDNIHSLVFSKYQELHTGADKVNWIDISTVNLTKTIPVSTLFESLKNSESVTFTQASYDSNEYYSTFYSGKTKMMLNLENIPSDNRTIDMRGIDDPTMGVRVIHKDADSDTFVDKHMTFTEFKDYMIAHNTLKEVALILDNGELRGINFIK